MSFKGKSLLALALLQSLLLAGVVWAGYAYHVQEETGYHVDNLVSLARSLAATASDAVIAQDLATLDRYAQSVRDSADLAYVHILDDQGRSLSGAGDAQLLQRAFVADEDFLKALNDDGIFDQSAIISLDGQVFGRVQLGLDLAPVGTELLELRWNALLISLGVALLMILATAILLQLMTRPLSKLALAASGMAEGDYSVALPAVGRDEIGQLTAGFASMREQVKRSQQALRDDALREARHAQEVVARAVDGIISIDEHGLICGFNPAAEHIFGYVREEVLGRNISLLMPEPDRSQHDAYLHHYQQTGEEKIIGRGCEVQGRRKDGSLFPMDLAVNAMEEDGRVLFTGVIRDITERRQAETALALQQQQLEIISRTQTSFITGVDPVDFFKHLLPDILALTDSTFGFLGELMRDESGTPYLAVHALNDMTWDKDIQQIFTQNAQRDLRFYDFDNLFTRALKTGQTAFGYDLDKQPHRDDVLAGYESLHDFLGVPLFLGERLLGMIGVANRPGGYDESILERLQPILGTCAQLFDALGRERDQVHTTRELQRANDLIESVLANLWAGMLVEDESRRILSVNPAYRKLFVMDESSPGLEGEDGEAEMQRIRSLFADPDAFERQVRDCVEGRRVVTQVELSLRDGRIYELEYIPIISSDDSGVDQTTHLWSYRNVTQRKQVEEQLRNQARDLLVAKDEAEAADKAKGQFLATMSHEIRTPLNGVLGMLHLLGKTPLSEKQQRFVSTAAGSGEMLLAVINDILDYSKLEAGKLELESIPFDPLELVEDIVALMARSTQEKGLELICAVDHRVPRRVMGDPTRLRQILTNLVNNAIKFTDRGDVVVHLSAVENGGIHFAVQDSGIGITPEQQQRLFKSFSQVDSSHTRKYGGTGLGLAICRRLVTAMGSEIRVVSAPGQGSVFGFSLPLKPLDEGVPQAHRQVSSRLSRQRILVVEENFNLLDSFCKMLLSWQLSQVGRAETGTDALVQLRSAAEQGQAYDIVLLDRQMPGMDGLQLAQAIRQDQGLCDLRLVMCSSANGDGPVPEVDAWLSKPVRQSELFNSLLRVLGEVSADRQPRHARLSADESWWFGGRRLLLVEDNRVNQEVAREILIDVGFAIEIRENGLDALQAVQEQDYDAVLMDIQMPVMDGLESARRIRALGGRFTDLPILAMTAHALTGDSDKSLAAGMNDHVTKPIDPERLLGTLAKWLEPTRRQAAGVENGEPEAGYADTAPEEIPDLPGIDVADGLARLRGNFVVYRRILLSFRDQQADAAERLSDFIAEADWEQAASLAHTLKGSGGNLGAKRLYTQAAAMEQACRSGDGEAAQVGLEALRGSLAEVMEGLARLDDGNDSTPVGGESRASDPVAMHALMGDLLAFLDSDLGEAQACVDSLRQQAGSDYVASLNELEGALNSFDIEAAKGIAQRVRNTL